MNTTAGAGLRNREDLIKCPVCEVYLRSNEGFTCPKCRRGPLCKSHRYAGSRECSSCVFDGKVKELNDLKRQEHSIRSLLRLLQFLFLVFAIMLISRKAGIPETIEFLQHGIFMDNLPYLGGVSVAGYLIFFFILYNQRSMIRDLESQINKGEFRKMVK
ncbi:MAG: hypothetical protein HZA17_04520 [Nitrospirae bacterium]|nr:hypothetical protein [Nitrospirota bacterium]